MIAALVFAAAYLWVGDRAARRTRETFAWLAGCLVLAVAFSPWFEAAADETFTVHMAQHLLIVFVAGPLFAMASPIRRWGGRSVAAMPTRAGWQILALGTVGLVGVLYVSHAPAIYDGALRSDPLHVLEHVAYLLAGFAFWEPVLSVDALPRIAGHGQRLVAVVMLGPLLALLAAVLVSADRPLYPAQHATMRDQRLGGTLMWIAPMVAVLATAMWIFFSWAAAESSPADDRRPRPRSTCPPPTTVPPEPVRRNQGS